MRPKNIQILALLLWSTSLCYSQNSIKEKLGSIAEKISFTNHTNIPEYMEFKIGQQKTFEDFLPWMKQTFNLSESFGLKLLNEATDKLGYTHYRYRQTYNNISLEGTMYLIHVKNNNVVSMNGLIYDKVDAANSQIISEELALQNALKYMDASQYIWGDNNNPLMFPKGELVYASKEEYIQKGKFHLSYKFDIYAIEPLKREYVFVNAENGAIVDHYSRIHFSDSNATAYTGYSKHRRITTNYTGANSFNLRETKRGNGIETYNLLTSKNPNNLFDFTNSDTIWNNINPPHDQFATDAHWGAEKTYDYYKEIFNRNSVDNKGFKLTSCLHYGKNYFNSFWDGNEVVYGDGDTTWPTGPVYPLVSIDICGHEITHGVSEYTAGFQGFGEQEALNESFSDIFGTMVEWYADSNLFEWEMGTKIGLAFRNMTNPQSLKNPDTYKGKYWHDGIGYGHSNGEVQNHWFYLLAHGDSGINDYGISYKIKGIGKEKASEIAYRTLTVYLSNYSGIRASRYYSIIAAEDLYGACSPEVLAVTEAWNAVGVGAKWDTVSRLELVENYSITQPNITRSSVDNGLLRINAFRECQDPITDTTSSFSIDLTGTTQLGNIKNIKVYYTEDDSNFTNPTLFGTYNKPPQTFAIKGSQTLLVGDNYFWITCDVEPYAKLNDTIDIACTEVQINQNKLTPNPTNTSCYHKISFCMPHLFPVDACKYTYIKELTMDSMTNKSGCSSSFYSDYNNIGIDKGRGEIVKYNLLTNYQYQLINIWFDRDTSGDFDTSEWIVQNQQTGAFYNGSGLINIPTNASLGRHQIRFHSGWHLQKDPTGCFDLDEGETEDYYINVTQAKPMEYVLSHTSEDSFYIMPASYNNYIMGIKIVTKHAKPALSAKTFNLNLNGTTDSNDVKNLKLWYTGSKDTFAMTKQFGTTIAKPNYSQISITDSMDLLNGDNYFWLTCDVSTKAARGHYIDAECVSILLDSLYTPDTIAPIGTHKISYCLPLPAYSSSACAQWISNVTIDSINNSSGCNNNVYSDYDYLSTSIEKGDKLNYSISINSSYGYYVNIWMDVDNDGTFSSSEWMLQNIYTPAMSNTVSGSFTIPVNTSTGRHQLRIILDGVAKQSGSACDKIQFGEVEDYTINVIPQQPMRYISSNTKQNRNSVERGTINNDIISIRINTKGLGSPLKAYKFKINTNGSTDTTNIQNVKMWSTGTDSIFNDSIQFGKTISKSNANIYNFSDSAILKAGTNYFWVSYDIAANSKLGNFVDAECISLTVDSVYTPDTTAPYGSREIGYCTPTGGYNNDYNFVVDTIGITKIELNTISNSSAVPKSFSDFYSDYHYIKTTLTKGGTYKLYITPGPNATWWIQASIAWVDWNQNSKFDANEKLGHIDMQTGRDSISFKVPSNQAPGDYRLRIMSGFYDAIFNATCYWDPCTGQTPAGSSFDQSECEDYTISVIYPKPVISPSAKINVCINSKQIFTTAYNSNYTYYWYLNGTILDSGMGHPHDSFIYIAKNAGTDTISVKAIDSIGQIGISPLVYIITNPASVGGTAISSASNICSGNGTQLKLSGKTGTVNWQYLSNGIWTNLNSSADSIYIYPNTSTDYRALATSGVCQADSSNQITVVVSQKPIAGTVSATSDTICSGNSTILYVSGNKGSHNWQYQSGQNWIGMNLFLDSISVSLNANTNYRVFAASTVCPSDSSSPISIIVNSKPAAGNISTLDSILCMGDMATISLNGNSAIFEWQYNDSGTWKSISSLLKNINVSPKMNTQYRVVASSAGCADDSSNNLDIIVYPLPLAVITTSNSNFCPGDSVELSSSKATDYLWSTGEKTQNIYIKSNATVSVSIIDSFGCKNISASQNYIFHTVANPIITRSGDTMFVSPSTATSYNWKLNGNFVITTTKNYYAPIQKGLYTVEYIDSNGCLSQASQSFNYITGITDFNQNISRFSVYPNPYKEVTSIQYDLKNAETVIMELNDISGKIIQTISHENQSTGMHIEEIHTRVSGVYILRVIAGGTQQIFKLVSCQ